MPRQRNRIPTLRHHKATGQGFAVFSGTYKYFGPWGHPETEAAYLAFATEYAANGYMLPQPPETLTVAELCLAFLTWAEGYYVRPDGTQTPEVPRIKGVIKALRKHYGRTPAHEFSPLKLRAVRQDWIGQGHCRTTINAASNVVRRIFKWGAGREMVPISTWQSLTAVEGLRAGRGQAPEPKPIVPAPMADIEAAIEYMPRPVAALVRLQLLTAARPGELLKLTPADIDRTGTVWEAELSQHKTQHRGRRRVLFFGPKAQSLLRPFLLDRPQDYCLFRPHDAAKERSAQAISPRRPGQAPTPRKTARKWGEHYSVHSYGAAIRRACAAAGVPAFTALQLRHTAATQIRKRFGLEAAQLALGHAHATVTEIYAERDLGRAKDIAELVG